jgi:hypothetical protein
MATATTTRSMCRPASVERRRVRDRCGCRCAWWRYNSGHGDGHLSLAPKGFGEGWARMAEGSEKQEWPFYPIEHCLARGRQNAALFTRVQRADLS